jgi:glycosyltransferase involved in cell wall biosynthesis
MIKVLFVGSEDQWRGGENQIFHLARGLTPTEFECHVAYPKTSQALQKFSTVAKVTKLPSRIGWDFRNSNALGEYCIAKKIQILDANSSVALSWCLKAKKKLIKNGHSISVVAHRRIASVPKNNYFTRRKFLDPNVDRFVAISDAIRGVLLDYGIDGKKVVTIPSALDTKKYLAGDVATKREGTDFHIGIAAALTKEKGHLDLLHAIRKLLDGGVVRGPNDESGNHRATAIRLLVAGDGKGKSEIENCIRDLNLQSTVQMLGHVDNTRAFLSGLDLFVLPSHSEGLGTILIEAGLCKLPVVATRVGGIPEIILDGKTGLLCRDWDPQDLAQKLALMILNSRLARAMGLALHEHVMQNYSIERLIESHVKLYRELV